MAITHTESKVHWSFFIALEQDVEVLTRYIEPIQANENTYSLELCRILFAAASECEVVLKELAKQFVPSTNNYNIERLREVITKNIPEFTAEKIFVRRYGLELDPWKNWRSDATPDWWRGYNLVKHERVSHYDQGNLQNALNAVAALEIAVVFFYYRALVARMGQSMTIQQTLEELSPESRLFYFSANHYPAFLSMGQPALKSKHRGLH